MWTMTAITGTDGVSIQDGLDDVTVDSRAFRTASAALDAIRAMIHDDMAEAGQDTTSGDPLDMAVISGAECTGAFHVDYSEHGGTVWLITHLTIED